MISTWQICFNHMLHFLLAVLNEGVKRPGVAEVLLARHNLPRQTFYHQTHETHTARRRPLRCDSGYVPSTRRKRKRQIESVISLCSALFLSLPLKCIVWHGALRRSHVAFRRRLNFKEMEVQKPRKRRMDIEESVHAANPFVNGNQRHNAGRSI